VPPNVSRVPRVYAAGVFDWWNSVELWVIGLPFAAQFPLVLAVLLPLFVVLAWLIDRAVDSVSARLRPWASADQPAAAEPTAAERDA